MEIHVANGGGFLTTKKPPLTFSLSLSLSLLYSANKEGSKVLCTEDGWERVAAGLVTRKIRPRFSPEKPVRVFWVKRSSFFLQNYLL